MCPTYRPGDLLLGLHLPRWLAPRPRTALLRPGRVVVVRRPERVIVKRLVRRTGAGWWVEGDHPDASASTDSRAFGAVPEDQVVAIVLVRLARGLG